MMQPSCEAIDDKDDIDVNNCIKNVIDPYEWDPSTDYLPMEEECDDLYDKLVGNKEWSNKQDNYDAAKLNETLRAQGVN
jgi:hypothetical protein